MKCARTNTEYEKKRRVLMPPLAGAIALASVALTGCSSKPSAVKGVDIDIPAVCANLVEMHDADRDGKLSEEELSSTPPFSMCFKKIDADSDGNVSLDELQARFLKVFNPKCGMIGASCRVTNNGRPLSGATVHFIPADYLMLERSTMPIASGITSSQGVAQMEIHPDYIPEGAPKIRGLVRPGFYLVDVTRPGVDIPAKYNASTTIGVEVSPETTVGGPIDVALRY
jgi:hypothetical protein